MPRANRGAKIKKLKSNRGAAKRFRKAGGAKTKFKCTAAKRRHQLTCKSKKMKRHARTGFIVRDEDQGRIEQMLPYA